VINMSTVDNIGIYSFPCICDLAEFYGIFLTLLAAVKKRYCCSGMTAVLFLIIF
jgi:hypothetical protein